MAHSQLDNLVRINQLRAEEATEEEIQGMLRSGQRSLEDARRKELSLVSRFILGYSAAHSFALAALRMHGYRSDSRYLVFQCLQHTVDLPAEQWRILDTAHRKRNLAEYAGMTDVDESFFRELIEVTQEVAARVDHLISKRWGA